MRDSRRSWLRTAGRWSHLRFDTDSVIRGLIIDSELGNIVKANRFGYVMRAAHGTRMMDFETNARPTAIPRWSCPIRASSFSTPLFSLSETCLYSQLVDLFDEGKLPGVNGYEDLFRKVRARMDETHVEGTLKAEIIADPGRFIDLDPDAALALLDQLHAGKKLMLISNAEWEYAREIMAFAFDPFLHRGQPGVISLIWSWWALENRGFSATNCRSSRSSTRTRGCSLPSRARSPAPESISEATRPGSRTISVSPGHKFSMSETTSSPMSECQKPAFVGGPL